MITAANTAFNTFVRTETTNGSTASQGNAASADAEKTAKLHAELTARLETIKIGATKFLDEKLPLKERLQGFSDFQRAAVTISNGIEASGWGRNNPLDRNDPVVANYGSEVTKLSDQVNNSPLMKRALMTVNAGGIPASKALMEGKHPAAGTIEHWDSLTLEEQDIVFATQIGISSADGSRQASSKAQYRADLVRFVDEQHRLMAGPTVGGASRSEKLEMVSRMQSHSASDYKAWQASRGNAGVVIDKIDLSAEGAKAAAETLSQPAVDGANDEQLKALETLKQVSARQREWLKSIQEDDKDTAGETAKSNISEADVSADSTVRVQIGSRVSVNA